MKQTILYQYLGTNGSILSPIHLENAYSVKKIQLVAEDNKQLTKDNETFYNSILIPEEELSLWKEVGQ